MFGINKIVKGYSIQKYFLYCYAIFISEDITRQRGGVTFGTPCISFIMKIIDYKLVTCFISNWYSTCISVPEVRLAISALINVLTLLVFYQFNCCISWFIQLLPLSVNPMKCVSVIGHIHCIKVLLRNWM